MTDARAIKTFTITITKNRAFVDLYLIDNAVSWKNIRGGKFFSVLTTRGKKIFPRDIIKKINIKAN